MENHKDGKERVPTLAPGEAKSRAKEQKLAQALKTNLLRRKRSVRESKTDA